MKKPDKIITNSKYKLRKQTKSEVRREIQEEGTYNGLMLGNKADPLNMEDNWKHTLEINIKTEHELTLAVDEYLHILMLNRHRQGKYPNFYKIIERIDD